MRRVAALTALVVVLAAPQAAQAASWAQPQIRTAVKSGLMGPSVAAFRPDAPLTHAELAQIVSRINKTKRPVADPTRAVTMAELDRALVGALGLASAGERLRAELAASGLTPPRRAGWEAVARFLDLRYNHPAESDGRERLPDDPAPRAEAAYSVARILALSDWELGRAGELAESFALPTLTTWQRRVLQRAVRFVGYPYVWGGTSEFPQTLFGVTSRGGFDCSGFVWRVFKLERWSGSTVLGTTIRGRTTYVMAGEIPRAARIGRVALRPADVIFFGSRGTGSTPGDVTHTGIAMGNGWFIQSSSRGTTIARLEGWYDSQFAWARRPIAEANLR